MDIRLAANLHAGITVTELAGSEAPLRFRRQPIVAMLGRTATGPVNEPTTVTSIRDYARVFGESLAGAWLPEAVEQFFAAGGRDLVVVRLVNGARPATLELPAIAGGLTLQSRFPGQGEALRAEIELAGQTGGRLRLTLQRVANGSIVDQEFFHDLTLSELDDRYIGAELADSRLVHLAGTHSSAALARAAGSRLSLVSEPGADGDPLSDYDLIGSPTDGSGLFALDSLPQVDFIHAPPEQSQLAQPAVFTAVASRYCEQRGALLVIDPPTDAKAPDLSRSSMGLPLIRYWPPVVDRRAPSQRVPVAGAVLGALSRFQHDGYGDFGFRAEATRIGRRYQPDPAVGQSNLGALAEAGVFVLAPRRDQTLGIHAASLYVPALGRRCSLHTLRLTLLIERALAEGTRWIVIHEREPDAWLTLSNQVSEFLERLVRSGLIVEPYRVRCDAITNVAGVRERGETSFRVSFRPRELAAALTLAITQAPSGARITRAAFSD